MAKQKDVTVNPFQEQLLQFQEAEKRANENFTKAELAYNNALIAQPQDKAAIELAKQNLSAAKEERDAARSHTERVANQVSANTQPKKGQKAWDTTKGIAKNAVGTSVSDNMPTFNDSFYRDITAAIRGTRSGNQNDVNSDTAKAQSQNKQTQAGQHQMAEQQSRQKAEQNNFAEADKIARQQNYTEGRQNVQKAGVLGAGAALARTANTADVQTQKNYAMQQQSMANHQMELANDAQQRATEFAGLSNNYGVASRDEDSDNDTASRLARGAGTRDVTAGNVNTINTSTGNTSTGNTNTGDTNTSTPSTDNTNTSTPSNDNTSTPAPQDAPSTADASTPASQDVSSAGKQVDNTNEAVANAQPGDWLIRTSGEKVVLSQEDIDWAKDAVAGTDYPSDERIKDIYCQLSDMRMKWIKEDYERDGHLDDDALDWLMRQAGDYTHGDRNITGADDFTSPDDMSVLAGYADFIHNYLYNYKPEAQELDSSINPEQDQIGPMAQDIEKVNPACITETPEGIKTVDTRKLALMNAGAIGDIARQLNELSEKLKALGV